MTDNRRVVLCRRPNGRPDAADFKLESRIIRDPDSSEILVRNLYLSLDPAMRRWMDADSYATSIGIGDVIRCIGIGRVLDSRHPDYRAGDTLLMMTGVEEHSLVRPAEFTRKIDPDDAEPLYRHLSLFGFVGMTAYFGLLDVGRPMAGETVLVSSAAGAVGSLVGQIAKIKGCRAVGIAGGEGKRQRLLGDLGFDAAIDYRGKNVEVLTRDIRAACPEGVDIYFDNVGGDILDAALACINPLARLVECGMVAQYNSGGAIAGPGNIWQIVAKTATMQGFLGRQYLDRFPEAVDSLKRWANEGRIHCREHLERGIENFYPAFMRLFDGSNDGKLILDITG